MAYLQEYDGLRPVRRHSLDGDRIVLGRHPDCDVVLDSAAVSRQHAVLVRQDGEYVVEDLGSRNGTFVNGNLISGPTRLVHGDRIRVCDVTMQFMQTAGDTSPFERFPSDMSSIALFVDDEPVTRLSSVTSKLDVSSESGGLQYSARPEVKLRALLEITQSLGRTLDLEEVYPRLLEGLFKVFPQADRGYIVMQAGTIDAGQSASAAGALIPKAVRHRRADSEDLVRISRTIVQYVIENKEAIVSIDAANDDRFDMSQSIVEFRIRSMMCAPILSGNGQAIGVIEIDTLDQRQRFVDEDLEVLAAVATQAAIAIDNAQLHGQLVHQEQVKRDLELARKVQQSMLPTAPPQAAGYHFFDFYRSAREVGGDYYDYVPLPDGRLAVVVADVSGKGISAALLMAKLSSDVRYCLASAPTPAEAIQRLNASLSRGGWQDRFVTLVATVIDPRTHRATVVNAGHPPPILRNAQREVCDVATGVTGLPLGVLEDYPYEQYEFELAPGDFLMLFTDGISEAMNPAGDLYGLERVRGQIGVETASVAELGKHLLEDVRSFVGNHYQNDDICLACFGRENVSREAAPRKATARRASVST